MRNFTWNRFPIEILTIDSLFTPIMIRRNLERKDTGVCMSARTGSTRWSYNICRSHKSSIRNLLFTAQQRRSNARHDWQRAWRTEIDNVVDRTDNPCVWADRASCQEHTWKIYTLVMCFNFLPTFAGCVCNKCSTLFICMYFELWMPNNFLYRVRVALCRTCHIALCCKWRTFEYIFLKSEQSWSSVLFSLYLDTRGVWVVGNHSHLKYSFLFDSQLSGSVGVIIDILSVPCNLVHQCRNHMVLFKNW